MEIKRTLSADAASGIKTDFIYEAGETLKDDKITIASSQDVTAILLANKRARNEITVTRSTASGQRLRPYLCQFITI